jgi:hypothetical protein
MVMAATQMEPPVALVVPYVAEHVGEGRPEESVPVSRVVAIAQSVVTPPLQACTTAPDTRAIVPMGVPL